MRRACFKKGVSLVELIVYIALLIAAVVLTVFVMVEISRSYGKNRADRLVGIAAETAMERIVREIRLACGFNPFVSPVSTITLNTFATFEGADFSTCSGSLVQRTIALNSGTIEIGGTSLMPSGVQATVLTFTEISDFASTKAIRVEMTLTSGSGSYQATRKYYATAILRGSYAN